MDANAENGLNEILYLLCKNSVSIMQSWIPVPSTFLSQVIGKSLYQTRKELKKLKEQGLVKSARYCEVTEDGNYLISGYQITDKAKSTPEYKKATEEEREICKAAFGIDIGLDTIDVSAYTSDGEEDSHGNG